MILWCGDVFETIIHEVNSLILKNNRDYQLKMSGVCRKSLVFFFSIYIYIIVPFTAFLIVTILITRSFTLFF